MGVELARGKWEWGCGLRLAGGGGVSVVSVS